MSRVSSRDKYVAQLLKLFKKKGLQLTMDVIAKELNITKKTLYNNFTSKDVLMRAVMKYVLEDIEFRINIALSQGKNAIEALSDKQYDEQGFGGYRTSFVKGYCKLPSRFAPSGLYKPYELLLQNNKREP